MNNLQERLFQIVFRAETKPGKAFDIILLVFIALSVLIVLLDSVPDINSNYGQVLKILEWIITVIFTLEYVLRIYIVKKKTGYIFSFYGIIDFLSVLPTYMAIFIVGSQNLLVIRALRFLRIFRVFKLTRYAKESGMIAEALSASRAKISVFLFAVLIIVIIIGTVMYMIEGAENGFTSIPKSIYWSIVTLTTVGYGDISPQTSLGQFIAGFVMILGYAIIAVPTGIVSVEISKKLKPEYRSKTCNKCGNIYNDMNAKYCKLCGKKL